MNRADRILQVRNLLNGRKILWVGTRCTDGESLLDFPELSWIFGQICPPGAGFGKNHFCLEESKALRVDLNSYDIDMDTCMAVNQFTELLLMQMSGPSVVIAYKPTQILAGCCFPNKKTSDYVGLFNVHQNGFEYKPWVESQVQGLGVSIVPWKYYNNIEIDRFIKENPEGPLVLRMNRGSGGAGMVVAQDPQMAREFCHINKDVFFSASRILEPNIPVSVNAVVFPDASVNCFQLSCQLIGLPECTNRVFGFCGNDFDVPKSIDIKKVDSIETATTAIGRWLHKYGYVGVFGIDFLLYGDKTIFVELNPRFMASTPIVHYICRTQEKSDVYVEHMAAHLGLPPLSSRPLREVVKEQPSISQLICYNRGLTGIRRAASSFSDDHFTGNISELPASNITIAPEGELFKYTINASVSENGHSLRPEVAQEIRQIINFWIHGSTSTK